MSNIFASALNKKLQDKVGIISDTTVLAEQFPIIAPETDDTARLQRALDFLNGKGTLVLASLVSYNVKSLTLKGSVKIIGNGSSINSVASDNTVPIFKNDGNAVNLKISDLTIKGRNRAIELVLNGANYDKGLSLTISKVDFQGYTRTSDCIYLRQIDFVDIQDVSNFNYSTFLTIESDYTKGERDNTQIHLRNIMCLQVKLGYKFKQIDKAVLDGLDVNECGSGFYFEADNKRIQMNACHVERYGSAGYDGGINYGYGYYFPDNKSQLDISLNNSTALLPVDNAKAGLYQGLVENLLTNLVIDNCEFDKSDTISGYKAVILLGSYLWKGRFKYDDKSATTWKTTLTKSDGLIEETGRTIPTSRNLLPFALINSHEQLSTIGTGTMTITNDTDGIFNKGRLITIATTSQYEKYVQLNLKKGWHTLLLAAYKKTGSPFVYVQNIASPYNTSLQIQPNVDATSERLVRVPFYVQQDGQYKVGIMSSSDATMVLNQIEVVRGFGQYFTDDNTICRRSAIPTVGYFDLGDRITNSQPAAGGYLGWVCVTSGTSFAFKGYGSIQA
ncbi:hypothetical protein ACDN41_12805 [Priestia aryabhattai]|uniref:hypothetical protein n=1 Tax=Priestia aryabhattai TaxID=412384 RepID=UPI0035317FC0